MPGELILIVDDEKEIGELVGMYLDKESFRHEMASNGSQAVRMVELNYPDLILLDVFLPDIEGYELCRKLREKTDVPIVFLTCRDTELDKVVGFSVGGDDYISKPFSPVDLIVRIKAHLRRYLMGGRKSEASAAAAAGTRPTALVSESIRLFLDSHEVFLKDRRVELSVKEFQLLACFMENPKLVLSAEQLLTRIWGYETDTDTKTLQVHIGNLRKKIEENPAKPQCIVTVRGVGYKFHGQTKTI